MKSFSRPGAVSAGDPDAGGAHARVRGWNGALALAFLAAYVALEWVSFIHEHKGFPITPWNPGLGLVFALMVFGGARYGAVLFAGVIVSELAVLQSSLAWSTVLGIAVIIAGAYSVAAALLRGKMWLDVRLDRLRDVVLVLAGGVAGAVLVAALLAVLFLLDAQLGLVDVAVAAEPLLVGDVIGIAVLTPLTLRLAFSGRASSLRRWRVLSLEVALYVAVVMGVLWIVMGDAAEDGFKLFYLLFLPVVVAAVRFGLDGACVGLALTQFGLVWLLHRYGYDVGAFTEFQILMLILTATGLIVGVVVSERENAERVARDAEARIKQKEAEAAQAARFALVSGMASALAHEINQPMTAARALARSAQHILQTTQPDLARAEGNLAKMIAQIDHAGGVVRRMRDFLRRGHPHVSTIELPGLIDDALALVLPDAAAKRIRIDTEGFRDLPLLHGDRVQLQQVILNLVRNAMDALVAARTPDGRIRIVAAKHETPARIEIGVIDNGPGIEDALAERLFQPLTTSKSEGLGLGLSICAAIVEAHGGRIWLRARQPGATEFRLSLPLDRSQPA